MRERYFHWLLKFIGNGLCRKNSYFELLKYLFNTEFCWSIPMDENRAADGIDLRHRFVTERNEDQEASYVYLSGPASVLEVLVALSIKMEYIARGRIDLSKSSQWFWGMIANLGLGSMTDDNYDRRYVEDVVTRFLRREYEPDGRGGLFTIRNRNKDLRHVEIWYQLCWYLDSYT